MQTRRAANVTVIEPFIFAICILAILTGCGGGSSNPGGPTTPGGGTGTPSAATSLYVFQNNAAFFPPAPSSVFQFLRTANGMVAPNSTMNGPANVIFSALTVDAAGNLYVAGQTIGTTAATGSEILVYAPGASGKATPARTIAGSATGMQALSTTTVSSMALDTASNLYVATDVAVGSGPTGRIYPGISVFPPTANGNIAPTKSIAGDATGIFSPAQIALDSAANIYLANSAVQGPASILVFNSSATGNAAPSSTLGGDKTTIYVARGVALDASGNIYVASLALSPPPTAPLGGTPGILEFSPGATGNVAPIRTISGPATTMAELGNLRVDSAGNIYVLSGSTILKFAADAAGNVAPAAAITSSSYFQFDGSIAVQ
jgi:hypothetical protein